MREAVESMDVWNAWDKGIITNLGTMEDQTEAIETRDHMINMETIQ